MNFSFHRRQIIAILKNFGNFERTAKNIDAYLNIPAPSIEQQLSSDKKLRRYLMTLGKILVAALFLLTNLILLWLAHSHPVISALPPKHPFNVILLFLALGCVGAAGSEFTRACSIYWKHRRRESQGSSHWATVSDLRSRNMLFPRDAKVTPTHLPLAYFGLRHQIAIPLAESREHKVVFGPPGSGKSDSFFIWDARHYSEIGAGIFLDTKGEIYKYSAHYYDNVYRIDFERPEYSDRIDLLSFCRPNPQQPGEDAKLAGEIASFMVGYDPNNPKGGENPFWPQSATSMLKCFLMFLAERFEHVQPADLFKVLAVLAKQAEAEAIAHPKNPPPHPLHRAFMNAHNGEIRAEWSPLSTLDEKTLGNIVISMTTPIACFRDPAVQTVFSPPSNEERARGCRVVDFRDLRRKGTAIYVVLPEGQASRLASVLGTVFGVAMNVLRRTGDAPGACDTIFQLDEAGNVPLRNLREDIGVGRGRRITFDLGYQAKNQPKTQYGADYAESFLQSCSIKVACPGLTGESAKWFCEMLDKTTTQKRTINDARADALDSERLDEVGVDLMPQGAFRTLERHKQCVLVINQAPPILARIPDSAKATDPRESIPQKFVWNEDDLRRAKRDELAERKFFERVRTLPRLPRSAFEVEHQISLAPADYYDPERDEWTQVDLMRERRKQEISAYALQLKTEALTSEEVTQARASLSQITEVYAKAPEEMELVDDKFAASVRAEPVPVNRTQAGGSDHQANGNGSTTSQPAPQIESTPMQMDTASAPQPVPRPQPSKAAPTSANFKRVSTERVKEAALQETARAEVSLTDSLNKVLAEEMAEPLPMADSTDVPNY